MKRLGKVLRLSSAEQRLLIKAALLLGIIRLGLGVLPFKTLRRLLAKLTATPHMGWRKIDRSSAERVTWAVEVAARHLPWVGSCLTQALVAQVLLARRGHSALLRIGVVRGEEGKLEAHAWLESRGKVVIGGSQLLERYTPLVALEKA